MFLVGRRLGRLLGLLLLMRPQLLVAAQFALQHPFNRLLGVLLAEGVLVPLGNRHRLLGKGLCPLVDALCHVDVLRRLRLGHHFFGLASQLEGATGIVLLLLPAAFPLAFVPAELRVRQRAGDFRTPLHRIRDGPVGFVGQVPQGLDLLFRLLHDLVHRAVRVVHQALVVRLGLVHHLEVVFAPLGQGLLGACTTI